MGRDVSERPTDDGARYGPPAPSGERRCAECGVKLSRYNPGPHCWQHTIGWPWRGPSARPKP
jgi:hypothetical protein